MANDFLLEVGVEEIPDWMIPDGLAALTEAVRPLLPEGEILWSEATPRRLALRAQGVAEREADRVELVQGPAKGAPEAAVAGFAKKQGVEVSALEVRTIGKAEKYVYEKQNPGRSTRELLAEGLPKAILGIPWPKTMLWPAKGGARFIRPIRWILCLLGEDVVPFTVNGIAAGNETWGHRQLGKFHVPVTIASYEAKLRENFVLLRAAERRAKIVAELPAGVKADAALLETLTYITEYPTAITGGFAEEYLQLPAEVLVTVMRYHQKYFSVEKQAGQLAPQFVAVMNTASDPEGLVRHGNERVLRARFNDARFFYEVDQQKPLASRMEALKNVTFQAQLGSYWEKTQRVVALTKELGGGPDAVRAAELAKTDLTTEMVKEFTELQGIVGGIYARAQGEAEGVAQAIYDHYRPNSMEDAIPATAAGQLLSLADKVDTLRGCFRIGLIPSGSKDPFALRRAAQGIVRILAEGELKLGLGQLAGEDRKLHEFLLDRVGYYFQEIRGYAYDEVKAVLAAGSDDLPDVEARLAAVKAIRSSENFEALAAGFKRIRKILDGNFDPAGQRIDETLLEAGPEQELYAQLRRVKAAVAGASYGERLALMATLRTAVDAFFDKVLVNAPDPRVRANRLTLLFDLKAEFSGIADFSEIVPKAQENLTS
ncbi:MAG: glycine--tRNA ligase subunit beta [Bryobacter sp.]